MQPKLLQDISQINGAWVAAALGAAGVNVPKITNVAYAPIGNGNSSATFQLSPRYQGKAGGGRGSLVLKIHASNAETAQRAAAAGVYRCEHEMTTVLSNVAGVRAPAFFHSAISEDGRRANILMEDLSRRCEPGDQIEGISGARALAAARELLKVHVHFWDSPVLDTFDWTASDLPAAHPLGAQNLHDRLADTFNAEQLAVIDKSLPHIDSWLARVPAHRTLIHGDCRADNMMFERTENGQVNAYIIDWATSRIGDAMADIAYLMTSSVRQSERAEIEAEALRLAVQEISKVQPDYSLDEARAAYRDNITSSMFMTLFAAAFIPQSPPADLLLGALARRNVAALHDWLGL